ncbi:MAG: glycoside hydrolase family 127 protein [Bacteroidales bacterium]|nr:glycoside hydrolase family 127 protein [Bacteroidales bacterium]
MKTIALFLLVIMLAGCTNQPSEPGNYPISPVNIRQVKLTDEFWLPKIKTVQQTTIQYALDKCRNEGRMDNFLIAGGVMKGETRGAMPFDDTDLYKIIEGASYSLIISPDEQLSDYLDSLIAIIETGQEEDGYLTTWRTINPNKPPAPWVQPGERWHHLGASHELYNSGHMFEAAAAHYHATGKRNFLEIALKNADLLTETFGPGKNPELPGHQIVETGLIKLFQITHDKKYLELAKHFLEQRGDSSHRRLFGPYSQDHMPVTRQDEVVGHAVRAVYMYAGMTDIAAICSDTAYLNAVNKLWENLVNKKLYITGGIGARHEGESFGENYELPNLTAYCETCAAIGSVYWSHRMFLLTGEAKYYDLIERTLYNGLISGISLEGDKFFYPNPLESDGQYPFNKGSCTRQSWFDCSCCPTNLIRFVPSVPNLIYAVSNDTLYINLYMSDSANVRMKGTNVQVAQETGYPWEGRITVSINPRKSMKFTIKLRIPGWAENDPTPGDLYEYTDEHTRQVKVAVNGSEQIQDHRSRYFVISRKWSQGDLIEMILPMKVRRVITNDLVKENQNLVALEYGPLVYCAEEIDNSLNIAELFMPDNAVMMAEKSDDLLGGINILTGSIPAENKEKDVKIMMVPYFAWSNRGPGRMKVWLPREEK